MSVENIFHGLKSICGDKWFKIAFLLHKTSLGHFQISILKPMTRNQRSSSFGGTEFYHSSWLPQFPVGRIQQ